MDNSVPDTKMTTRKRDRNEIFSMCSSTLSVISIVLGFALFARIETVARDLRTMDAKFSPQIQQIRDVLKESSASSHGRENFDTSNGRVTENLLLIFFFQFSSPNIFILYMFSCIWYTVSVFVVGKLVKDQSDYEHENSITHLIHGRLM